MKFLPFFCFIVSTFSFHVYGSRDLNVEKWNYASFDEVELYSQLSEKKTDLLGKDLKVFIDGMQKLLPAVKFKSKQKFRIIVAKNKKEFDQFVSADAQGQNFVSVYNDRFGYTLIVVKITNNKKDLPYLYGIISKKILNSHGSFPHWFTEGMSELYESFEQSKSGLIKFGKVREINMDWVASDDYKIFAPKTEEIFRMSEKARLSLNSDDRMMYEVKAFMMCHYFSFNENKAIRTRFVQFAQKCRLEGYSEELLWNYLSLKTQDIDRTLQRYRKWPYIKLESEVDYSGFESKTHPDDKKLHFVVGLSQANSDRYYNLWNTIEYLQKNYPDAVETHELEAIYYKTMDQDREFENALVQLVEAGSQNSFFMLNYASLLQRKYLKDSVDKKFDSDQIKEIINCIKPKIAEAPNDSWATRIFLYTWANSRMKPPVSLNPHFVHAFKVHRNDVEVLLNLARFYVSQNELENLEVVIVQMKRLTLNTEQLRRVKLYERKLEEMQPSK